MKNRIASGIAVAAVLCLSVGFSKSASAHRLDEYLQATRISVRGGRIVVEIDLTPGVDIAPLIFASINSNHDGRISAAEGQAYAKRVLNDIVLDVDGKPHRLALDSAQFPSFQLMSSGEGTIRIQAGTEWQNAPGTHLLSYQNNHQPELSVFLVNALVPSNREIQITDQQRDSRQRGLRLAFTAGR